MQPMGKILSAIWATVTSGRFLLVSGIVLTAIIWILIIFGLPVLIRRLPADYFSNPAYLEEQAGRRRALPVRIAIHAAKNLAGVALVLIGTIGFQGVLVVMLGLYLMDIPGKGKAIRRLAAIPFVWRLMGRIRAKAGIEPLENARMQ